MNTLTGIPFRNMINRKVITADERTVKLLYSEQQVTIIGSGWADEYHVIVEDGTVKKSMYSMMSEEKIKETFDIDIKQY